MLPSDRLMKFSDEGDIFLHYSSDDTLKIRDTVSNNVKQECNINVKKHGACSCLIWIPIKQKTHGFKKPKLSKRNKLSLEDGCVAVGTEKGDIFVYSALNTEYFTELINEHSDIVNDLGCNIETETLFSCSSDSSVAVWDIPTGKIKSKWKTNNAVYSVCVIDENNLLTASCNILWWSVPDQTLIKKFSSQHTTIFKLLPVYVDGSSSAQYFLSAARNDNRIKAWTLKENNKNSIASFVLESEPQGMEISRTSKNKPSLLTVLTKDGSMHLFEHMFNGKIDDGILPKSTVHITSKSESIPILSTKLSKDLESCTIVYGSPSNPIFEIVNVVNCPKDFILVKEKCHVKRDSKSRINQTPKLNGNVSLNRSSSAVQSVESNKRNMRKELCINNDKMSLEYPAKTLQKIDSSSSDEDSCSVENSITFESDDLLRLLLQGLETENHAFFNTVLKCDDDVEIRNTLAKIPQHCIKIILEYLYEVLKMQRTDLHARKWLKELLRLYLPHIISCDEMTYVLNNLNELIKSKRPVETISKICSLRGLLSMYQGKQIDDSESTNSGT